MVLVWANGLPLMPTSPEAGSAERWGALPLGELHAEDACYLCGHRGEVWDHISAYEYEYWLALDQAAAERFESEIMRGAIRRTVDRTTLAVAMVCVDVVACERRRYNERRKL